MCLKPSRRTMRIPTFYCMAFQGNQLAQLERNFKRSCKSHHYTCNSDNNLLTRGPALFLLPFRNPMKFAVVWILETDLWSRFPSAFLLGHKNPVSTHWTSAFLATLLLGMKVCRQEGEGKPQTLWLAAVQYDQK